MEYKSTELPEDNNFIQMGYDQGQANVLCLKSALLALISQEEIDGLPGWSLDSILINMINNGFNILVEVNDVTS